MEVGSNENVRGYGKQTIAGVGIAVPVMASVTPTIAQHVARKPDEYLFSNTQSSTVVQEGAIEYVVSATTSTSESVDEVTYYKVKRFPPV